MKLQFILAIVIASTLIIGASGCQKAVEQQQQQLTGGNVVIIKNFAFNPPEITINAGESVTWKSEEPATLVHTVTSDNLQWSLKLIGGQNFSRTFNEPGEYPYHCAIHPSMKGKVIVI